MRSSWWSSCFYCYSIWSWWVQHNQSRYVIILVNTDGSCCWLVFCCLKTGYALCCRSIDKPSILCDSERKPVGVHHVNREGNSGRWLDSPRAHETQYDVFYSGMLRFALNSSAHTANLTRLLDCCWLFSRDLISIGNASRCANRKQMVSGFLSFLEVRKVLLSFPSHFRQ